MGLIGWLRYNQQVLVSAIKEKLQTTPLFVLEGHTTLLTSNGISKIPIEIFAKLNLEMIIAISLSPQTIFERRTKRDKLIIDVTSIKNHQDIELSYAHKVAQHNKITYQHLENTNFLELSEIVTDWLRGKQDDKR